ncbi:MAG: adenosylcobinamide-GDP ribazoletransferase [Motiliproteus sp.]|nr:adenosylcobinamide-GDP ribazoletransferase [Motiliproteus sp.]MCW9051024.1 adenosylcobinamide-GDP ribazoletransferase [Motiliproteus sp.]
MAELRLPEPLQSLVLAFQFLTRIPMPDIGIAAAPVVGRSLLFYPLVGLVIGAALWLLQLLTNQLWPQQWELQAALILMLWCLLSGGLHLDGLADSADAWVGGMGDPERTLELMKDPRCGPMAVVIVVLLLLTKFAAIGVILSKQPALLLLAPPLGRGSLLLLFLTTAYVRVQGIGAQLVEQMPRNGCWLALAVVLLLPLLVLGAQGLWVLLLPLVGFFGLRALMIRRLGGTTGDTAGAMVEIIEMLALLALAI